MKYKVIEDDILDLIKDGYYKVGDQIESDTVLSAKYDSSELTINRALTNLARKGYLKRIKGTGTYVESAVGKDEIEPEIKTRSLSENVRQQGMVPGSKLLDYHIIKSSDVPEIMEELNTSSEDLLHFFIRVRYCDDKPFCYSVTYMPVKQIPYLDVSVLDKGSLYEFLGTMGFKGIDRSYHRINICEADEKMAEQLDVEVGKSLLHSCHIATLKGSKPYMLVDNYIVSERYTYEYQLNSFFK